MSILELPLRYTDVGLRPWDNVVGGSDSKSEKPSPGLEMLRNAWKAFDLTQFESLAGSLAEGLVKRALALGPRGPGRLITEAGNELMSRPALRSVGLEENFGKPSNTPSV